MRKYKGNQQVSKVARLTPKQVREIRELCKDSISQPEIARRYSVSQATISNIHRGKIYRGVV